MTIPAETVTPDQLRVGYRVTLPINATVVVASSDRNNAAFIFDGSQTNRRAMTGGALADATISPHPPPPEWKAGDETQYGPIWLIDEDGAWFKEGRGAGCYSLSDLRRPS